MKTSSLKATVIVPTSIDRGPILPYSVGSILRQTVTDLEVFVIGDGVHDVTRDAVHDLMRQDERVRFFDHPKGTSRGELYRHAALQEARGEIVCYLCDRDLYLPHHVELMAELVREADFAHSLVFKLMPEGFFFPPPPVDATCARDRAKMLRVDSGIPLPFAAHTLAMYRRLPYGWRPTPGRMNTDLYMWRQFLEQPDCRVAALQIPTALNFKRGRHPGWSTERRLPEVKAYAEILRDPVRLAQLERTIIDALARARSDAAREDQGSPLRVFGYTPGSVSRLLNEKISWRIRHYRRLGAGWLARVKSRQARG